MKNITCSVRKLYDLEVNYEAYAMCLYVQLGNEVVDNIERMDAEEDGHMDYMWQLEHVANKAEWRSKSSAEWIRLTESKLEDMRIELALHDRIQDHLDLLDTKRMGNGKYPYKIYQQLVVVGKRLDVLKAEKKLGYAGWILFKNQLHGMLGWKQINSQYQGKDLADRIVAGEVFLAKLNEDWANKEEHFSDPHEEADEFIQQQVVVVAQ